MELTQQRINRIQQNINENLHGYMCRDIDVLFVCLFDCSLASVAFLASSAPPASLASLAKASEASEPKKATFVIYLSRGLQRRIL